MKISKTIIGEYCYIIQAICKCKTCKKCTELKEPDRDGNGEIINED